MYKNMKVKVEHIVDKGEIIDDLVPFVEEKLAPYYIVDDLVPFV